MTATTAEALELALWLHRAPARRTALLGRPLPDGIGQLLRVAGGAKDQLAAAAAIAGEDEAIVLEAVRFYLQQILFHDEADAYRILGLRPDAEQSLAREHHRLLQLWLHPDRSGGDAWDSVYATRINRAWGQLRTPQARAAYDATLGRGENPPPIEVRHAGEYQVLPARPMGSGARRGARNGPRYLAYAGLLGCVGLLVLIAVRQEAPPQWSEYRPAGSEPRGELAGNEEPVPAPVGVALADAVEATPALEALPSEPDAGPLPAPASVPATSTPTHLPVAVAAPDRGAQSEPAGAQTPVVAPQVPDTAPVAARAPIPAPVLDSDSDAAIAAAPEPVRVAPSQAPVATATASIPDAYGRMSQAQSRTRAVLAYLGDPSAGPPPVWNDVRTMKQAEHLRAALHRRREARGRVPVDLQDPQWRLSADGARVESGYRAGAEHGRIALGFTWRENQLLLNAIALEPDA